jgi:hypothetical protein
VAILHPGQDALSQEKPTLAGQAAELRIGTGDHAMLAMTCRDVDPLFIRFGSVVIICAMMLRDFFVEYLTRSQFRWTGKHW